MRKAVFFCFLLFLLGSALLAQQNTVYSQYMLNGLGMNPAYAGEAGPLEIIMGRRSQWAGFPGAPVVNFAGACKAIGKKGFYHSWHGVGAYMESNNEGAFAIKTFSLVYAWHKRLAHDYTLSAGFALSAVNYSMDASIVDARDPALYMYPPSVFIFPVLNPGVRLVSKKMYFDFSAKQATANETVGPDGVKELGTNNRLMPTFYFTVGRNFVSPNYAWTYTPSIQLRSALTYYPTFDLNLLVYYHRMIGIGISYRDRDSFVGMIQFRYKNKIVLGLSYDYSISRFSTVSANSREIIFGYTPYGSPVPFSPGSHIAQCPGFDL